MSASTKIKKRFGTTTIKLKIILQKTIDEAPDLLETFYLNLIFS